MIIEHEIKFLPINQLTKFTTTRVFAMQQESDCL